MARRRRRAPAHVPLHGLAPVPLHGPASRGIRSLWRQLCEMLPGSAPAWLRRLAAALRRLLGGPAQSVAPTGQNTPRRPAPAAPPAGPQGGDASNGACPAAPDSGRGLNQAAPRPKLAQARDAASKIAPRATASKIAPRATASKIAPGITASKIAPGTTASKIAPGTTAAKIAPATAKKARSELGMAAPTATGTKTRMEEPLHLQEEAQSSSDALLQGTPLGGASSFRDDYKWESVKIKKRKRKGSCRGLNLHAQEVSRISPQHHLPFPQIKRCFDCKKEGHLAKDCPAVKARTNLITSSDQVGKSYPRKPKIKCCSYCKKEGHLAMDCPAIKATILITSSDQAEKGYPRKPKGDEDNYNLDLLFAEDEEEEEQEDAETKAHRIYKDQISGCKKGWTLCLACHLEGKTVHFENVDKEVKLHFANKHSSGIPCAKKGCLARAETKRDI